MVAMRRCRTGPARPRRLLGRPGPRRRPWRRPGTPGGARARAGERPVVTVLGVDDDRKLQPIFMARDCTGNPRQPYVGANTGTRRVCDRYVGPDAFLLVAGFSWLYVLQPDPEDAGQRRAGELSAPEQAI